MGRRIGRHKANRRAMKYKQWRTNILEKNLYNFIPDSSDSSFVDALLKPIWEAAFNTGWREHEDEINNIWRRPKNRNKTKFINIEPESLKAIFD